jgi:hypothetical protein
MVALRKQPHLSIEHDKQKSPVPIGQHRASASFGWTRMKNAWWDEVLSQIDNLAELKVVQYVYRHTIGYHQEEVSLSIDEIMQGRLRSNGQRLDRGTGLCERSVKSGIIRAIAHGYLVRRKDGKQLVFSLVMSGVSEDEQAAEGQTLPSQSETQEGKTCTQPGQNVPPKGVKRAPQGGQNVHPKEATFAPQGGQNVHPKGSKRAPTNAVQPASEQASRFPKEKERNKKEREKEKPSLSVSSKSFSSSSGSQRPSERPDPEPKHPPAQARRGSDPVSEEDRQKLQQRLADWRAAAAQREQDRLARFLAAGRLTTEVCA